MIAIVILFILFDAFILPSGGYLSGIASVLIIAIGVVTVRSYKHWFIMSLMLISIASAAYLLGDRAITDSVVHKLSDWTLVALVVGVINLARVSRY